MSSKKDNLERIRTIKKKLNDSATYSRTNFNISNTDIEKIDINKSLTSKIENLQNKKKKSNNNIHKDEPSITSKKNNQINNITETISENANNNNQYIQMINPENNILVSNQKENKNSSINSSKQDNKKNINESQSSENNLILTSRKTTPKLKIALNEKDKTSDRNKNNEIGNRKDIHTIDNETHIKKKTINSTNKKQSSRNGSINLNNDNYQDNNTDIYNEEMDININLNDNEISHINRERIIEKNDISESSGAVIKLFSREKNEIIESLNERLVEKEKQNKYLIIELEKFRSNYKLYKLII